MKEVKINYDNLTDEDMDELVIRLKAIIINDNNEIMFGYSHGTYQFPGGHLEDGETLEEGLIREIKEETGITLKLEDRKPIFKRSYYTKNYHNSGLNRKNEIYYYLMKDNLVANMNEANLDEWEKVGNYTIKIIPIDKVEEELNNTINDNPINEVIHNEIISVLKELKLL